MIFFFYGEDSFRAHQKINAIKKKFQEKVDKNAHNIETLDGETLASDDFFKAVTAMGFLADKKLVVVKNLLGSKSLAAWQDDLLTWLKSQQDSQDENYVIFFQSNKPDARTKLYKALKQYKFAEEFAKLPAGQLSGWIKKYTQSYSKEISDTAISLLINYVGNNLWQMSHELDKLAHYSSDVEISDQDVRDIVQAKVDDNIFALIDAIAGKDKAVALKLIEDQLNSGVNHQYILTMIVRQFRLIIKARALGDQIRNSSALAQTLKIHPLVAEKTLTQSKHYDLNGLKNIYSQLLELDEKFKTTSNQEKILFARVINSI